MIRRRPVGHDSGRGGTTVAKSNLPVRSHASMRSWATPKNQSGVCTIFHPGPGGRVELRASSYASRSQSTMRRVSGSRPPAIRISSAEGPPPTGLRRSSTQARYMAATSLRSARVSAAFARRRSRFARTIATTATAVDAATPSIGMTTSVSHGHQALATTSTVVGEGLGVDMPRTLSAVAR
jgi:hypothetical protein